MIFKFVARKIINNHLRKKLLKNNKFNQTNHFPVGVNLSFTEWGQYSGCNKNCDIANTTIGNFTSIGPNVIIGPRNHIVSNFTTHDFIYTNKEHAYKDGRGGDGMFDGFFNKIGNDVWIGANSIVLQGVEIGDGAVVAAGTIVSKSVPPYAVVGGVPASIIKFRFDQEIIVMLQNTNWYHWPIEKIINERQMLTELVRFDLARYKEGRWKSQEKNLE